MNRATKRRERQNLLHRIRFFLGKKQAKRQLNKKREKKWQKLGKLKPSAPIFASSRFFSYSSFIPIIHEKMISYFLKEVSEWNKKSL